MIQLRLAVSILALWVPATVSAQNVDPEDSGATIFLSLRESGEGAPSKAGLGRTVILTDLRKQDPWYEAVQILASHENRDVIAVHPWKPAAAFKRLAKIRPEFVIGVFKPETLDVNFHFDLLERASQLDRDAFVDCALGYVTGATAEEAAAFARTTVAARKSPPPKVILEFGPTGRPSPLTPPVAHPWAAGFSQRRLGHPEEDPEVARTLGKIEGIGVFSAWGHGMPEGVDQGLQGKDLRTANLDLFPALYFSGPCYCGVPGRWFKPSGGSMQEARVAPEDSFLLALLKARVAAAFAGLDPDRGETNHHELEHLLTTGDALGYASKSTYDDAVLAYRRPELELPHFEAGKRDPHRNLADTMIAGGACRALYGDPSWAPFAKAGASPFEVQAQPTPKGIRISWVRDEPIGSYWLPVDVFRADGGWTHRLRFRCQIPKARAKKLRALRVLSVTKDGQDLPVVFPTAAVEMWGGKAFLHAMVVFPRNEKARALWKGRRFEAHLEVR